jgi:hypothetical protein
VLRLAAGNRKRAEELLTLFGRRCRHACRAVPHRGTRPSCGCRGPAT